LGEGTFKLLTKINEIGTLTGAAQELGMSYRYAWGLIKEVENNIGMPILKTYKGGKSGGGGAVLTEEAQDLLSKYEITKKAFLEVTQTLNAKLLQ
jgi:molybdate transport repressor ModE-like protein